jgi:hypothetical protein
MEKPGDELGDMLRAFFREEVPAPWPELKPPQVPAQAVVSRRWYRLGSRLALAASVGFLVLGYWLLAGAFPKTPAPAGPVGRTIAKKNLSHSPAPKRVSTPGGGEALMWERIQPTPGDRPTIVIQLEEIKGPGSRR